jgi:hypothetical protein
MKTDKELLELAALAVGFVIDQKSNWNPLNDDGQALRLAVKLKLDVTTDSEDDCCCVWAYGMPDVSVKYDKDPYAATRRAIVRAAAAIGEKL